MIRCRLAVLMGERKVRVADVARDAGVNRSLVTGLYYETTQRIDLESVNALCRYFGCKVEDLFVYVPDRDGKID